MGDDTPALSSSFVQSMVLPKEMYDLFGWAIMHFRHCVLMSNSVQLLECGLWSFIGKISQRSSFDLIWSLETNHTFVKFMKY